MSVSYRDQWLVLKQCNVANEVAKMHFKRRIDMSDKTDLLSDKEFIQAIRSSQVLGDEHRWLAYPGLRCKSTELKYLKLDCDRAISDKKERFLRFGQENAERYCVECAFNTCHNFVRFHFEQDVEIYEYSSKAWTEAAEWYHSKIESPMSGLAYKLAKACCDQLVREDPSRSDPMRIDV